MKRKCKKCNKNKDIKSFHLRDKTKPEGLRRHTCKKCRSEISCKYTKERSMVDEDFRKRNINRSVKWNKDNVDKSRAASLKHYHKNKEEYKRKRIPYEQLSLKRKLMILCSKKRRMKNLSSGYIKELILTQEFRKKGITVNDISESLIDTKKKSIILKRKYYGSKKIKENK